MDKKRLKKIRFFPNKRNVVDQGFFDNFFNKVFVINKTEKKIILSLLEKSNIETLLFYTDLRNISNILKNGITAIENLKVEENESYYVWSYLQHDSSIDLEFDTSSRAYFWKWTNDLNFNPKTIAVIGINPKRLSELTQKDWFLDRAQNFVNISETILPESFDWILVQDIQVYKEIKKTLKDSNSQIDLYFGSEGIVKTQQKSQNLIPDIIQDPDINDKLEKNSNKEQENG